MNGAEPVPAKSAVVKASSLLSFKRLLAETNIMCLQQSAKTQLSLVLRISFLIIENNQL